ncbi:putative porin [Rheinheimera marina]|uniref:Porin n=1 Tax=Rheinheimera marina TaxID=1774958 RepID=A0ABV9JRA2_9GAMM
MKSSLLALMIAAVSTGVAANGYQNESTVNYGWGDLGNTGLDFDAWQLSHRFFLTPVDTSGATPLAESAFINKNASVFGTLGRTSVEDYDQNNWSVGGEYMSSQHNFYGALEWTHYSNTDDQTASATLGYFITNDWLAGLLVEHNRPDGEGSYTNYGIMTKKLWDLGTGDMMNLEANILDYRNSSATRYGVGADYYFGKNFSAGVGYQWISDDVFSESEDSLSMRARWFAMQNLSVQAEVAFDTLETGDDVYSVGVSYRF